MKAYQSVAEILDEVRKYHHRLSDLYRALENSADSKRLEMLLEYMSRHEQIFERALARYEESGRRKILGTWYQYVADEDLDLRAVEAKPHQPIDEVVDMALEFDEKLVRFYEDMAQNMSDYEDVRAFFQSLAEQEKQERAQLRINAEMIKKL
jgi:rubrerythrin